MACVQCTDDVDAALLQLLNSSPSASSLCAAFSPLLVLLLLVLSLCRLVRAGTVEHRNEARNA